MRALCWDGVNELGVHRVPDPGIVNPHDVVAKVILSSVCGSDLHLLGGYVPTMQSGDVIGHEFLAEVIETGSEVRNLSPGDRVVVSSIIGCGDCFFCKHEDWSLCDNSNPNAAILDEIYGYGGSGIFGYSHAFGGYAGSHAEYIRIPFAERGAFKVPEGLTDEQAVFCSDAFPTGYMAADLCGIEPGDTVAVWGCGGVGQMAMQSAWLMGAERVIAIDRIPERLDAARHHGKADVLNYEHVDISEALDELTGGRGPDRCIDAVGMESHGTGISYKYDKAKQSIRLATDRTNVLRQAIYSCRKGGTVSIVGVYGGLIDKFPMGAAMNKALTLRMGQMHGQRYIPKLLELTASGEIDPSFLLTHRWPLERGPQGYDMFKKKTDRCMRVVFDPWAEQSAKYH